LSGAPLLSLLVVALATLVGLTAANTVATSHVKDDSRSVTANDRAPTECAGITVTSVVNGTAGTNNADLLLGTSGVDNMSGAQGDDCILGGGGIDNLNGGPGTDVCIGGPGLDTFHPTCETQIQ
jgi:Ca2+-binding RTX toxin-like protein